MSSPRLNRETERAEIIASGLDDHKFLSMELRGTDVFDRLDARFEIGIVIPAKAGISSGSLSILRIFRKQFDPIAGYLELRID